MAAISDFLFAVSDKVGIPDVDIRILENRPEPVPQITAGDAPPHDSLQKSAAAGSANHTSRQKILNRIENLLDQRIGAAGVYHPAQFPMFIQKSRKIIDMAAQKLKPHEREKLKVIIHWY